MKRILPVFLFLSFIYTENCKGQPVALRPDITIDSLTAIASNAVKLEYDSLTNSLYYHTFEGDVYQIIQDFPIHDSLIATTADHDINYMQGFVIKDSMMLVCGNHKTPGMAGYGVIACGVLQPDGTRLWHNVITTETYPSTATLYDHAFSAIIFNPAGDSILFASGSRTDHGEVQSTNGLFPGTREVALTSKIFIIPANASNLYFPNDETALDSMGVIYARGVRNTFDLSYDASGNLFGVENSCDRDDPEELNWIRKDNHYGFPWEMGGNQTPMQFAGYDASQDLLINHHSLAWGNNYFYDDSLYPQKPASLIISQPVKNFGPDADKYRNPLTGAIEDASDNGSYITSFTPHRSPLGLTFDKKNKIGSDLTGDAFVLSYTRGTLDSTGTLPDNSPGPFADLGEDLLQLELSYDSIADNYSMNTKKIVEGFHSPVDALLIGNLMYVVEIGAPPEPSVIRMVSFPPNLNTAIADSKNNPEINVYPNPVKNNLTIDLGSGVDRNISVEIFNVTGQLCYEKHFNQVNSAISIPFSDFADGVYVCKLFSENKFLKTIRIIHQ